VLNLTRRHFLQTTAALPFAGPLVVGAAGRALARSAPAPRILLLLELNGGNDGLNTVVPFADPLYAQQRPTLAVPREKVLQLDENLGLHPALEPLMPFWQGGELAVALGVGYARPNRSHFRSIEIWNSASAADETLQDGWLHRVLSESAAAQAPPPGFAPQGIVLGGPEGPLAGAALAPVVMRDPRQLAEATRLLCGELPVGAEGVEASAPQRERQQHAIARSERRQVETLSSAAVIGDGGAAHVRILPRGLEASQRLGARPTGPTGSRYPHSRPNVERGFHRRSPWDVGENCRGSLMTPYCLANGWCHASDRDLVCP